MRSPFERGVFTLSLDFELVWGSRDLHADPSALVRSAVLTRERVFEHLVGTLTRLGMVATWATVGHLFLAGARREGGRLHPDIVPPKHAWRPAPWFDGVPEGTEAEHPAWYGRTLVERLRDVGQEVGSHSFSHPIFGDPGCSREAADSDLARAVAEARALGITLRSFVFPRNVPGHFDLLAKHGFTCWRGREPVWYRDPRVPGAVSRAAHFADTAIAGRCPTVLPYRDNHGLWVIPASGTILPIEGVRAMIPLENRVVRLQRCVDAAVEDRCIAHAWTHPINLASDPPALLGAMDALLEHAARWRDRGRLDVLPMGEIATRAAADAAHFTTPGAGARSARS